MTKTSKKHFHLPLQTDLYDVLRQEAKRAGVTATAFVREAIVEYVTKKQREALGQAIQEYAEGGAQLGVDFDPDLERASVEFLLEEDKS